MSRAVTSPLTSSSTSSLTSNLATERDFAPPEVLPLSLRSRQKGKRLYYLYGIFNSVSYAVLAEGLVILMLLRLGATEIWVGAVAGLIYLSMPFMAVGYRTIARLGVSGTAGLFWFLRSCSAAFMIASPWAAAAWGGSAGLWFMFAGSLGFMLGRAGGMVAFTGIITELTTHRDRGDLITTTFKFYQSGAILVTVLIAVFLGNDAPLYRYQLFFAVGLIAGVLASIALWRLPEAGLFRNAAPFSLRNELRWSLSTPGRRWFLAMMVAFPIAQGLSRTFLILVAKQGYGLSDQVVVALMVVGMLGGIVASYSYGLFLDQLGSRPLLVLTGVVDMAGAALVVVLPPQFSPWLIGLLFVIGGYVHTAFLAATQHYFISITSTTHQLPQGILTQGAGGIAGGLALYAGGWVLANMKDFAGTSPDALLHFRWFFAVLLVLLALRMVVFIKLPPLRSQGIRDSLNALFSPWDWRAIHAVKRAIGTQNEDEESQALAAMMRSTTGIYQDDLERYLGSPSFFVRRRAMDSLFLARPSPTLIDILLNDVEVNPFTTAHQSAFWLGRWKVHDAVPRLRAALESPDFQLRGSAVHALVDLDDHESLPLIEAAFAASDNPYVLIEGARALSMWGEPRHYAVLLHKYHLEIAPQAKDELSLSVARLLGLYDGFYQDLGMLHRDPRQLFREWQERLGGGDEEGLVEALQRGAPRRSLLQRSLHRQRGTVHDWFYESTEAFLALRPENVWPEMAFLMTYLLLTPTGIHRNHG